MNNFQNFVATALVSLIISFPLSAANRIPETAKESFTNKFESREQATFFLTNQRNSNASRSFALRKTLTTTQIPSLAIKFRTFTDKLNNRFNLCLGSDFSFLQLKSGVVDVSSNLYQKEDINNNYVAYETSFGIGFQTRLFKKLKVQPNVSILEYHIARYNKPQNVIPDIEFLNIRHRFFSQLKVSLDIYFGL